MWVYIDLMVSVIGQYSLIPKHANLTLSNPGSLSESPFSLHVPYKMVHFVMRIEFLLVKYFVQEEK